MSNRVKVDDLLLAADWCEEYEAHPDGFGRDSVEAMTRVAAWLRAEAKRRQAESMARDIARRVGVPVDARLRAKAREALKREEQS